MIKFELDTGSEVSTITLKDKKKRNKKIESCDITFKNFDLSNFFTIGYDKKF